jgi:hypothetical protein
MIKDDKELNDMLNRAAGYLSGEGWDKEAAAVRKAVSRIEKLEAALREIVGIHPFKDPEGNASVKTVVDLMFHINITARRALKEEVL